MKAWLSRAGIAVEVFDVDEDDAAYQRLMAWGIRRVPLTLIGDTRIVGYDERALADHFRSS